MAALMRVASALRRIGQQNSAGGQDRHLIYANDQEVAMLKAQGGSGRPDPVTGIPHFAQDKDGPEGRQNGRGDSTDSNDGTGGGDGSDGGKDTDLGDVPDRISKPSIDAAPGNATFGDNPADEDLTPNPGDARKPGGQGRPMRDNGPNVTGDPNSIKLLGAKQPFTDAQVAALSTPGVDTTIGTAASFSFGKGMLGFLKGMSAGNLALAVGNGIRAGYTPGTEGTVYSSGGITDFGEQPSDKAAQDHSDLDAKQKQTAAAAASVPPATDETKTPVTPTTSDIDLFSTLSRNRYNRKNQMLGGLLNVSGVTVTKPTLGA